MPYLEGNAHPAHAIGPHLLGTYESELHPTIEEIIAFNPEVIVDVGAGVGYYAIGLLTRLDDVRVVAFEADVRGRSLIRMLGNTANVADRLSVLGVCKGGNELSDALVGRLPVVIMDVEGMEEELLDPGACPRLRHAAILVEVHEELRRGVSAKLLRWYGESHCIKTIPTIMASKVNLPAVDGLTKSEIVILANELRPAMWWYWMVPRQCGASENVAGAF